MPHYMVVDINCKPSALVVDTREHYRPLPVTWWQEKHKGSDDAYWLLPVTWWQEKHKGSDN